MEIEIEATAAIVAEVNTVDDLRKLVAHLNKYNVANATEIELSSYKGQRIYVTLTGDNCVEAEWIECGDHVPPDRSYDVIISTHAHDEQIPGQTTIDEVIEPQSMHQPSDYDWPRRDREKRMAREQGYL